MNHSHIKFTPYRFSFYALKAIFIFKDSQLLLYTYVPDINPVLIFFFPPINLFRLKYQSVKLLYKRKIISRADFLSYNDQSNKSPD